jgi:hypothetical protein
MASTVRGDAGGSIIGLAIVFVAFVFRSFIPAPSWVWLVVVGAGVLLALKDGISGLAVITLVLAGVMIVGTLVRGDYKAIGTPEPPSVYETATPDAPDTATPDAPDLILKKPIPVPAEYGFRLEDSDHDSARLYRSQPMRGKTANATVAEIVDFYVNGLAPEWTVVERKEDWPGETVTAVVKLRQGDTPNGIGIDVYALVPGEGRTAVVILMIQALNCGEDVPALPPGEVCWQGLV